MNIKSEISVDKVRQDAEDNYRNGYFCCEALMAERLYVWSIKRRYYGSWYGIRQD